MLQLFDEGSLYLFVFKIISCFRLLWPLGRKFILSLLPKKRDIDIIFTLKKYLSSSFSIMVLGFLNVFNAIPNFYRDFNLILKAFYVWIAFFESHATVIIFPLTNLNNTGK